MRSLFFLAISSLFLVGDLVSAATEIETAAEAKAASSTIEAITTDEQKIDYSDLHIVDRDVQSRRKDWDIFGVLLMMINSDCGPHGRVHVPDCRKLKSCESSYLYSSDDCTDLCNMASQDRKSHYANLHFCKSESSSSSSSSAATGVDAYNDNSAPGSFVSDGNYAAGFEFWMAAVVASVAMAMVAVHIGQRREYRTPEDESRGAPVRGSVGRRVAAVAGLMNGVLSAPPPQQVEMAEYQLDDNRNSSYQSAIV